MFARAIMAATASGRNDALLGYEPAAGGHAFRARGILPDQSMRAQGAEPGAARLILAVHRRSARRAFGGEVGSFGS